MESIVQVGVAENPKSAELVQLTDEDAVGNTLQGNDTEILSIIIISYANELLIEDDVEEGVNTI